MTKHPLPLAIAAAVTLAPFAARAQNSTVAEALYREGVKLLEAGKVHEACVKLAESQRAEPAIGTLMNLATCHEKEGKTATAWGEFVSAAELAHRSGQGEREEFAKKKSQELEKQLHRLMIEVASWAPGMVVKLDGEMLGQGAIGTSLPLDPGDHEVVVSAPGKKAWSQHVSLGPGAVNARIEVPALEDASASVQNPAAVAAAAPSPPPVAVAAASPSAGADQTPAEGSSTRRTAGFVLLGVGAAGGVTALALGVRSALFASKSAQETTNAANAAKASDKQRISAAAQADSSAASTHEAIALVAGGASALAVGAGLYLVLTSRSSKASAFLAPSPAGLVLRGSF